MGLFEDYIGLFGVIWGLCVGFMVSVHRVYDLGFMFEGSRNKGPWGPQENMGCIDDDRGPLLGKNLASSTDTEHPIFS